MVEKRHAAAMAIALLGCVSCGTPAARSFDEDEATGGFDRGSSAASTDPEPGAPVQGVATFTAADVARILLVVEQTGVEQARLAEAFGTTLEVKIYAARMVRERTEAADRIAALLAELAPRSEDPTPALMEEEAKRTHDALEALPRSDFDLPFMTAEVTAHARLLGLIEASLLPSARRAPLRGASPELARALADELVRVREITSEHVVHALRVQGVVRTADPPSDDETSAGRRVAPPSVAMPAGT